MVSASLCTGEGVDLVTVVKGYDIFVLFLWTDTTDLSYIVRRTEGRTMTHSEFKRWLKQQGCTFEEGRGKGGHITIHFHDRKTVMPNHGSKEIGKGLVQAIKKQLGLK